MFFKTYCSFGAASGFMPFPLQMRQLYSQNAMSNGIEMVCEMASEDSDWSVSSPPSPNWNGIRTTKVVNSGGKNRRSSGSEHVNIRLMKKLRN
jgi:hypothetical protein